MRIAIGLFHLFHSFSVHTETDETIKIYKEYSKYSLYILIVSSVSVTEKTTCPKKPCVVFVQYLHLNHLNNFEIRPTKDHSCEVRSKSNLWFRRCCLKKLFTDGWTDWQMHNVITKAHYVTGELKTCQRRR